MKKIKKPKKTVTMKKIIKKVAAKKKRPKTISPKIFSYFFKKIAEI